MMDQDEMTDKIDGYVNGREKSIAAITVWIEQGKTRSEIEALCEAQVGHFGMVLADHWIDEAFRRKNEKTAISN